MLEKLKCKVCGSIFIAEHNHGKPWPTCSDACNIVYKRRRAKIKYAKRTPEQRARYNEKAKEYYRTHLRKDRMKPVPKLKKEFIDPKQAERQACEQFSQRADCCLKPLQIISDAAYAPNLKGAQIQIESRW